MGRAERTYRPDRQVEAGAEALARGRAPTFLLMLLEHGLKHKGYQRRQCHVYLSRYNDEWDELLEALPKIPEAEAALFCDLLSKVFVYEPTRRPTAMEMLSHPWFHLDEL